MGSESTSQKQTISPPKSGAGMEVLSGTRDGTECSRQSRPIVRHALLHLQPQ
jgi:hypothetical protein